MPRKTESPDQLEEGSPLDRWLPLLVAGWIGLFWTYFYTTEMPNSGWHRLDFLNVLPDLLVQNFVPHSTPEMPAGWSYLSQRMWIAALAIFIVVASTSAGRLVFRSFRLLGKTDRVSEIALTTGVGLSLISLVTLLFGILGFLDQVLFVALLLLLLVVDITLHWQRRKQFMSFLKNAQNKEHETSHKKSKKPLTSRHLLHYGCGAVCLFFLGCMALGAMLPSTDFDVKEYHLQGPKEFFLTGHITFLPHNVYTSFPFLTEMLSLCGMVVSNDWQYGALVGKAVLMCFAPLTALGVFSVAMRISGNTAGWIAATFYLTTPWVTRISIIAYTEGALCCYAMLSLLTFIVLTEQPRQRLGRWSLVYGFLAGSAISTKYPGLLLVAFPAGAALLLRAYMKKAKTHTKHVEEEEAGYAHHSKRDCYAIAWFCLGILAAFGPWMFKNFAETNNPVYPLLYSVFGGVDWNADLQQKWKDGHPPLGLKNGFVRLFTDVRVNLIDVAVKSDWQSAILVGFAPLAFLCRKHRQLIVWTTLHVVWMWLVWYIFTHRIDRFWLPILPGLAILAGIGFHRFWEICFTGETNMLHQLCGIIAPFALVSSLIFNYAMVTSPLIGFNAYLLDLPTAITLSETPSVVIIENAQLNKPKVLFVGEAQVFDTKFPHEYNTVFDQSLLEEYTSRKTDLDEWELLSVKDMRENFRRQGITHVFVNWNEILRYRTTYRYTNFVSPDRMQQLINLGVLKELSLPQQDQYRLWESLAPSWQQEIERWGPVLKKNVNGREAMILYQMYEVAKSESSS